MSLVSAPTNQTIYKEINQRNTKSATISEVKAEMGNVNCTPPAKTAREKGTLGMPDEAIQSLRPTTDNEDHVQRIEIEIRTKAMKAEHSRLSVVPHNPGL